MKPSRLWYALAFSVLLITEILIALYVRDAFIRPYGGDILVTILIGCLIRIAFPNKLRLLPLWVFLFSVAVETAQYFDIVTWLGLGDIAFFRILIGTSFAWLDIVCYGIGCLLFWGLDALLHRSIDTK
ncbi:MAG: DUF2809 domain-containing protein [Ruminococcaceae bacterium]|nr:DUF2809 domain-containing protein [Oscillospiraceae bacterium]